MSIKLPDTPVFRACNAAFEARRWPDSPLNLNVLWEASGRLRGRSPEQWAARCHREGHPVTVLLGGQGESFCSGGDFFEYAQYLDPAIERFVIEIVGHKFRERPGEAMLRLPTPVMALATEAAIVGGDETSPEEARRRIMGDAIAETAGMGPWEQETKVAEVQRAMAGSAPELIPDLMEPDIPTEAEDLETSRLLILDALSLIHI